MIFKKIKTSMLAKADENCPRNSEATVFRTKDGSLILAWEHFSASIYGPSDGAPTTINAARSYDDGETWQDERVIVPCPEGSVNVYSPSFLRMKDGALGLFYFDDLHWSPSLITSACLIKSYDEGETWGETQKITEKDSFFATNDSVIRISSGRILIPSYHRPEVGRNTAWTIFSDDDGITWEKSDAPIELPMRGALEPFVAEKSDGSLVMVMRTQLGSMFRSESVNGGKTWSKPQTTGLVSPESCPFIRRVPGSEAMVVVWNNSEYNMNWASHYGKRSPLTIAVTYDGAHTFEDFINIETDPKTAFSNPGGTWISDDTLLLTYWTEGYNEKWIMDGPQNLKQAKITIDRSALRG